VITGLMYSLPFSSNQDTSVWILAPNRLRFRRVSHGVTHARKLEQATDQEDLQIILGED
jgi:hypothetical protein